ncbi:AAA family ATPase [Bacillus sp. RO1]|uniref:AAA family ATPase n=1 Tax=Bacillus sp. RO1 TaxID=2722703 RepID=UPI0014572763|nr:AAA family ATPase [Bacillus sp. RO1]NLP52446.1 AAA family ATPase [Bacillus sp. RO1]
MKFIIVHKPWSIGETVRETPYIELLSDNWDDFSYKTLFTAYYFDQDKQRKKLGEVKILHKEKLITSQSLDASFTELSDNYCSLGQTMDYYRKLSELPKNIYSEVLYGLRDIAFDRKHAIDFLEIEGFKDSLLRSSEANKAYKTAYEKFFLNEDIASEIFKFKFKYKPPYSEFSNEISFDYEKYGFLPNRMNILIGKNGTGKTQLLSSFADALCGKSSKAQDLFEPPSIPLFSKVIAVSFSAFDNFRKPYNEHSNVNKELAEKKQEKFNFDDLSNMRKVNNYVYCGIQDSKGKTFSLQELKENGKRNYQKIKNRNSEKINFLEKWKEILLNTEIPSRYLTSPEDLFTQEFSSGQNIIVSVITEIVANIEDESILLFDEPELHLHPNAISNLVRMLYKLLEEFNSYAIISTHSPLLVQEIPSHYINKMERTKEDLLFVNRLNTETFGENVSSIINDVFNVRAIESNYKTLLEKAVLVDNKTPEEINSLFPLGLSLHAMTYLNILLNQKNRDL